jgi:hypothetical protein
VSRTRLFICYHNLLFQIHLPSCSHLNFTIKQALQKNLKFWRNVFIFHESVPLSKATQRAKCGSECLTQLLRRRRSGGSWLEANSSKRLASHHLNQQAGCGGTLLWSDLCRDMGRKIRVRGWLAPRKSMRTYPQKN